MVPVGMLLCKDRVGDGAKTGDHSLVTVLQHCKLLMGEGHWTIKVTTGWLGTLSNWAALAWGQTTYKSRCLSCPFPCKQEDSWDPGPHT